jgi:hypothetical protein
MKAAVKKKKVKKKKRKEKSLPNLFKYFPGPGAKLSGSCEKFSDPGGKIPGSKISGSWGEKLSVPLAWERTLCDEFAHSANTPPSPPPHPALNDPEKRPFPTKERPCDIVTWRLPHSLARAQLHQRRRDARSIIAVRLRF